MTFNPWHVDCLMNNEENAAPTTTISDPSQPPQKLDEVRILSKRERVDLIYAELQASPAASSREEALELFDQVFRKIEDAHSGTLHDPHCKVRLCPPIGALEQTVEGKPWLRRYRHTDHYTLIAENGAIEIRIKVRNNEKAVIGERTVFEKKGANDLRIEDLK